MNKEITKKITLKDGREITITTGKLARQALGSVEIRMGKTHMLATVVSSKEARDGVDFYNDEVHLSHRWARDFLAPELSKFITNIQNIDK